MPERGRPSNLRLLASILTANAVGAVVVFVYFTFVVPVPAELHASQATIDVHHRVAAVFFVALLVAFAPLYVAQFRRSQRPVAAWLANGGAPDAAVRRAVLSQPLRQAAWSLYDWLVAAVVFAVFNTVSLGDGVGTTARIVGGIVIGGLATSALNYMQVERELRPLFARVLSDGTWRSRAVPIRTRLLLSWALGSGLALAAIAVGSLGMPAASRPRMLNATIFLAVVGLIGGGAMLVVAARSVTDPLDDVRSALAHVESGDLDVEVDVTDGGEVGLLQSGFNHMVAGLRERKELADLFGRHVGVEVARIALEQGHRLGGEQRQVSALFVDLIGSTSLAERCPPEDVVAVLNAMFTAVVAAVTAEGGWVNKFEGDGALCVFGAPVAQHDHAARALRAARAVRAALVEQRTSWPQLDAAIAVSTGTAVAGNVGAVERFEYTVIGDPINEAARLTEHAKHHPGRLLVAEASVEAAGSGAGRWVPEAWLELRGRSTPTRAYRPADAIA